VLKDVTGGGELEFFSDVKVHNAIFCWHVNSLSWTEKGAFFNSPAFAAAKVYNPRIKDPVLAAQKRKEAIQKEIAAKTTRRQQVARTVCLLHPDHPKGHYMDNSFGNREQHYCFIKANASAGLAIEGVNWRR